MLAEVYRDLGEHATAELECAKALDLDPNDANAWYVFASIAVARQDFTQAVKRAQAALVLLPRFSEALLILSYAQCQLGHLGAAEAACLEAMAFGPESSGALLTLATIYLAQGDAPAAEAACERCLALHPEAGGAHEVLGLVNRARGEVSGAREHFQKAVRQGRDTASVRYNLSTCNLLLGDYAAGFEQFESRFEAFPAAYTILRHPRLSQPTSRWRGENLRGRSLLLWAEQGSGDVIMMLRYLRELRKMGVGRLVLACDAGLRRLALAVDASLETIAIADLSTTDPCDLHCPVMSLPHCLGTTAKTVPGRAGYIDLPADYVASWRGRLSTICGPKVGVVWAGSRDLRDDLRRSLSVDQVATLFDVPGVQWINLQKDASPKLCASLGLHDWMAQCDDFAATAGLAAGLDLVVSVDTSVAHLAAGMGVPVWLLNRFGSEWRWGTSGSKSVWYDSVTQFRQAEPGDWSPTLVEVKARLQSTVRSS